MKIIELEHYSIVVFGLEVTDNELSVMIKDRNEDKLIYVALEGTSTEVLSPNRFLVKNRDSSFDNHMMWEGMLSDEDKQEYIIRCAQRFYETGKQMVIEDYDFKDEEVFYDYSN